MAANGRRRRDVSSLTVPMKQRAGRRAVKLVGEHRERTSEAIGYMRTSIPRADRACGGLEEIAPAL